MARGSRLFPEKGNTVCLSNTTGTGEEGAASIVDVQERVPLFEALCRYVDTVKAPLHVPGHKMGRYASKDWRNFIGTSALSIDLTEAPGLDDLHAPEGPIREAQELAARAFGACESHFLVGGTTAGLHALVLAACPPGTTLALPRNAHRSVLGALILGGVTPAWVKVEFHDELDLATRVDYRSLEQQVSTAAAALLINPTYYGLVGRLAEEIACVKNAGLPALVDEAHGAHFAFHPGMPPSALSLGADGVVQSIHKTGGSLTQSSMCHLGKGHILSPARVREMLRLVQSTSPSYLLMASLDMARRELALRGRETWQHAMELASDARSKLAALPRIRVHPSDDPTKVIIDVRGRGVSGFQAADWLWSRGVAMESAGLGYVLAVMSPGDSAETVHHLVTAVRELPEGPGVQPRPPVPPWPEVVLTPREAYLGKKEHIPLASGVGRIAAEMVAPYPPGIPVVAPGELITAEVVSYLQYALRAGFHLQGPSDPNLRTIQVIKE